MKGWQHILCLGLLLTLARAVIETPLQADSVLDKSCVVTYFGLDQNIANIMKQIGFRLVRTEPYDGTNGMEFANWLGAQGIKTIALVRPTDGGVTTTTQDLQDRVNMISEAVSSGGTLLDAIEGLNEPNIMWDMNNWSYNGKNWVDGLKPMSIDLWNMVQADPVLRNYPVLGPAWSQSGDMPYAPGEFESITTWGNYHPYPTWNCFQEPFAYNGLDDYFCDSADPINTYGANYAQNPYVYNAYIPVYGNNALVMTETGYATTAAAGGYNERVQGKYTPRIYLENILQGYERTCIYQLVDSDSPPDPNDVEQNWGLLRYDLSLKPAAQALKGLFNLIKDPGAQFTPVPLDITITVTPNGDYTKTDFVHHLLFQKRTGTYYLALWHEISVMQVTNGGDEINPYVEIFPPDLATTITLKSIISTATVYSWDDNGVMTSKAATLSKNKLSIKTSAQDRIRVVAFTLASNPGPLSAVASADANYDSTSTSPVPFTSSTAFYGAVVGCVVFLVILVAIVSAVIYRNHQRSMRIENIP